MAPAYYEDDEDVGDTTDSSDRINRTTSAAGGNGSPGDRSSPPSSAASTTHPYPPLTEYDNVAASRKSGGGGGGGGGTGGGSGSGRNRCPKCGTYVTFRHGDFHENAFYCAACSGWFHIPPTTSTAATTGDASPSSSYDELLEKRVRRDDPAPPHILMQHIPDQPASSSPKTYGTTHQQQQQQQNQHSSSTTRSRSDGSVSGSIHLPPEMTPAAPTERGRETAMDSDDSTHSPEDDIKKMPTPKQIMSKLNEYVIGQRKVKVALSVGVYNHYKRIFVAESQAAAAEQRKMMMMMEGNASSMEDGTMPPSAAAAAASTSVSTIPTNEGPALADLNLGQVGSSSSNKEFCEAPDINSIADPEVGRDMEDCEIDKSNIMLLGPTGSGTCVC